jgi:tRNA (mo5U34)-methyltransferase
MRGMRALDVATFDGFWAFEMERRGADVVAVDVARSTDIDIPRRTKERLTPDDDRPMGAGFKLAKEALGSRVQRHEVSVYDLSPGLIGEFDLVFMSDLLLHLRDPQRALEMVYLVTRPQGSVVVAEPYDRSLDRFGGAAVITLVGFKNYVWSMPSRAALKRMMNVAGFDSVTEVARLRLDYRSEYPIEKVVLRGLPQKRRAAGE